MNPFTSEFDGVVQKALDKWHIPGISLSIVHKDKSWSRGYGVAIRPSEQTTPSTLNYGASTTKGQLCALWAIYIRSESNQSKGDNKITLSTPIADIIPEDFVLEDEYTTSRVTVEDCLSHQTGYPCHQYILGRENMRTTKDITRMLRNLPAQKELRTGFEYCNLMYIVASYALEVLIDKPLSQIFHELLWDPLGMTDTHAGYDEAVGALKDRGGALAKGYTWSKLPGDPEEDSGELREEQYMHFPEFAGAGYIISTANDYAKWMSSMLNGSYPLSEDMANDLLKPRVVVNDCFPGDGPIDGVMNYCLGWFTGTYRGTQIFWNPGLLFGSGALILLVPKLKWGVAYFSNGAYSVTKMKCISYWLLDRLIDTPVEKSGHDASNELVLKTFKDAPARFDSAIAKFYSSASSTPQAQSNHLIQECAGRYSHPGFGSIEWIAEEDKDGAYLRLDLHLTQPWPGSYTLRHISDDCWVGIYWHNALQKSVFKAQVKTKENGQPDAIGFAIESSMPDHLMWFTRV